MDGLYTELSVRTPNASLSGHQESRQAKWASVTPEALRTSWGPIMLLFFKGRNPGVLPGRSPCWLSHCRSPQPLPLLGALPTCWFSGAPLSETQEQGLRPLPHFALSGHLSEMLPLKSFCFR